jgi:hypothetical protein
MTASATAATLAIRVPARKRRARETALPGESFQQTGGGKHLGLHVHDGRVKPADPAILQQGLLTPFTADPVIDRAFVVRTVNFTNRKMLRYFLDEILHQPTDHNDTPYAHTGFGWIQITCTGSKAILMPSMRMPFENSVLKHAGRIARGMAPPNGPLLSPIGDSESDGFAKWLN